MLQELISWNGLHGEERFQWDDFYNVGIGILCAAEMKLSFLPLVWVWQIAQVYGCPKILPHPNAKA